MLQLDRTLPKTQSYIGMDVGLKEFAILSDGTTYKNSKFFGTLEDKLEKAQCSFLEE
ncbi:transposase [Bacillus cereus]|nr:transposase [Bacillus cereus]